MENGAKVLTSQKHLQTSTITKTLEEMTKLLFPYIAVLGMG